MPPMRPGVVAVLLAAGSAHAAAVLERVEVVRSPTLEVRLHVSSPVVPLARTLAADGEYGEEGFVYQAYAPIPRYGSDYATIGAWIVGDEAAGIGIREDESPITRNTSRFVPHYCL